jgi:hypothetical protein
LTKDSRDQLTPPPHLLKEQKPLFSKHSPNLGHSGKQWRLAERRRWERLVLKGCDDPYFSLNSAKAFIKLKKDYIAGLGDTADFAIVVGIVMQEMSKSLVLAADLFPS